MINEILVCLDGSSLAEKIIPLAQGIAAADRATLSIFRVMQDAGELTAEEDYLRDTARRCGAQIKFAVSNDPAQAIVVELEKNSGAMAAMTTHGRTAWAEAILGSVAFRVLRGSPQPVLLYSPIGGDAEAPKKITTLAVALDGSDFAEKIIPFAVAMTKSLAAALTLIQALPVKPPAPPLPERNTTDFVESSYLHRQASAIKKTFGLEAEWEVLHGDAGDAISRYIGGIPEAMLAITTHGGGVIERAVLGSMAGKCIRKSGVPLLVYWPR